MGTADTWGPLKRLPSVRKRLSVAAFDAHAQGLIVDDWFPPTV
jgi:hypothetical protein